MARRWILQYNSQRLSQHLCQWHVLTDLKASTSSINRQNPWDVMRCPQLVLGSKSLLNAPVLREAPKILVNFASFRSVYESTLEALQFSEVIKTQAPMTNTDGELFKKGWKNQLIPFFCGSFLELDSFYIHLFDHLLQCNFWKDLDKLAWIFSWIRKVQLFRLL